MNGDLSRIGLKPVDEDPIDVTPDGLSEAGRVFWDFIHERQVATGNDPRAVVRSKLMSLFSEDLKADKSADERFMEDDHDYIQWLFPLETVGVNPEAPVVPQSDHEILSKDENFRIRMYEHFLLFIEFMGIKYDPANGSFQKVNVQQWASWIDNGHNNLRISRILTSMKNFGLAQVAEDFLQFLHIEAARGEPDVIDDKSFIPFRQSTKESCREYWMKCLES